MKPNLKLQRLFQAAKVVSLYATEGEDQPARQRLGDGGGEEALMPEHLKTRILAHWRSATEEDSFLPLALRRALVCAGLIMIICVAWGVTDLSSGNDEAILANIEFEQDMMQ